MILALTLTLTLTLTRLTLTLTLIDLNHIKAPDRRGTAFGDVAKSYPTLTTASPGSVY
jgi:hypothetical protein